MGAYMYGASIWKPPSKTLYLGTSVYERLCGSISLWKHLSKNLYLGASLNIYIYIYMAASISEPLCRSLYIRSPLCRSLYMVELAVLG